MFLKKKQGWITEFHVVNKVFFVTDGKYISNKPVIIIEINTALSKDDWDNIICRYWLSGSFEKLEWGGEWEKDTYEGLEGMSGNGKINNEQLIKSGRKSLTIKEPQRDFLKISLATDFGR